VLIPFVSIIIIILLAGVFFRRHQQDFWGGVSEGKGGPLTFVYPYVCLSSPLL